MHKNNPLYESQEISMDMFREPDYDDDDLDDEGMPLSLCVVIITSNYNIIGVKSN